VAAGFFAHARIDKPPGWLNRDTNVLLEDDPGLARGLDIAFEYGVADLEEDDEWIVGDLSRLNRG